MTQSPLSPTLPPSQEFVQHYIDSLENLPLEIQRHVTQLREYDQLCRNKMEQVGRYLVLYRNSNNGPVKKKFLNKIQKCLIKSQQYGDDKLNIIAQIIELVEARTQQVSKDAHRVDLENKEESIRTNNQIIPTNQNHRMKIDKGVKIPDKLQKNIYEKPKRQARRARVTEKVVTEKVEKSRDTSLRHVSKEEMEEEEEEDEEIEEEEEAAEVKVKKEVKRKEKVKETKEKEKEKEKEKVKEEKEERKEELPEKRKTTGKVTKKASTPKHVSKIKKKKKKEKESTIEDVPVDPDEPTYCICNSISYGDMIGCDNDECDIEWFHFCCVNLTHKPKGKWYCPRCTAERKERSKK